MTGSSDSTLNYDVFLSTAPEDVDFAAAVARSLGDRGLRVRFEEVREGSLGPGRAVASGAIGASTVFLAIYSHAYARRRDCQSELALALIASADSADPMRHIMVLNPEPESNHILPPRLMNALAEANPEAADREEIATLANEVEARALKVLSPLGRPSLIAPPPFHGLPDLPERAFVGRADLLWTVHGALWEQATHDDAVHEPKVVVLHGDSGMGKTSVAIEYARRFGAAYPGGVFWLRGYGEAHAHGGMLQEDRDAERDRQIREIAADLGVIISNRSPTEIRFALDEALERRRLACLWVVDGLPPGLSENEVRRWIGSVAVAKTVVTTFSEDYLDFGSALAVEPLGVDDGFALLTAQRHPVGIVEETAAARGAVQDLGGHPLALAVAGALVRDDDDFRSFITFRKTLNEPSEAEMGLAIDLEGIVPDGAEIPIGAVFSRAIARVGLRGGAHGRDLLRMAAAMAPAPFSAVFFERVLDTLGAPSASRDAELSCASSVKQCLAATADRRWKNLTVHPLTSRAVRFAEEDPARDALVEAAAVSALLAMLPRRYDPSAYSAVEFEIVHARELVRRATTVAQTELMGRVARYDLVRGAYASGAELYRTQLDTYRRLYGDAHPDTVTAMSNLAGARFVTGDFRGAQRLHEEVVRARRRDPGDEHQDTLTAMSNLAATLSIVGDLAAARELQEEMLTIRHRVFGQDDPKTTGSAWNLFLTLNEIEDRSAAESVFSEHLSWLLDREPASLANEQRRIRDAVADVAVRNRALSNRSWGAARRNV